MSGSYRNCYEGLVVRAVGGFYYVKIDGKVIQTKPRGIFRKEGFVVLPGDRVKVTLSEGCDGIIEEVTERKNFFTRPPIANMDQVFVVISVKKPKADLLFLDKLLIMAKKEKITPVLCVNKIDIDDENLAQGLKSAYGNAGVEVILVSAKTKYGLDSIEAMLDNRVTCFAGQSGVGKSSILNAIAGKEVMETGIVSKKIGRGKHTTRHIELVEVAKDSYIADTPGFTSFEIKDITLEDLQNYYPEIKKYEEMCRFSMCSHIKEPDCRVKTALEDGKIDDGRYKRYCELYNYIKEEQLRRGF